MAKKFVYTIDTDGTINKFPDMIAAQADAPENRSYIEKLSDLRKGWSRDDLIWLSGILKSGEVSEKADADKDYDPTSDVYELIKAALAEPKAEKAPKKPKAEKAEKTESSGSKDRAPRLPDELMVQRVLPVEGFKLKGHAAEIVNAIPFDPISVKDLIDSEAWDKWPRSDVRWALNKGHATQAA